MYPRTSASLVQHSRPNSINPSSGSGGRAEAQLHTVAPSSPRCSLSRVGTPAHVKADHRLQCRKEFRDEPNAGMEFIKRYSSTGFRMRVKGRTRAWEEQKAYPRAWVLKAHPRAWVLKAHPRAWVLKAHTRAWVLASQKRATFPCLYNSHTCDLVALKLPSSKGCQGTRMS